MTDHLDQERAPQRRLFRLSSWREAKFLAEALRMETVGGALLLLGAVVALIWANTPWADTYEQVRRSLSSDSVQGSGRLGSEGPPQ